MGCMSSRIHVVQRPEYPWYHRYARAPLPIHDSRHPDYDQRPSSARLQ